MQIAVVRPGDTLTSLARRYGVSAGAIARTNGMTPETALVPGQALVIPIRGRIHVVRPGESLFTIARRYGVSVRAIRSANNLSTTAIQPGTRLLIPPGPKMTIEANGYMEPSGTERDRAVVDEAGPHLTYVSMFSYRAQPNGDLVPLNDETALSAVRGTTAVPMMVITNFREGNFSPEVARSIFTNRQAQQRLIANVIRILQEKNFRILNIDFENLFPADRERYNAFLRTISSRVRAIGRPISTSLAPKTGPQQRGAWYEAHDYPAHGRIVDFVILMTYEWGWSGGPPLPVAPIPQVRRILDYAVSVIPREKLVLSAPLYGYDWTLPYVRGGPFARRLGPQEAVDLARREGATIRYDSAQQAPTFRYTDDRGREHVVWFEDARSMQAKFDLIKEYGLRGISYWELGQAFPQNWVLLEDNFNIRKYK